MFGFLLTPQVLAGLFRAVIPGIVAAGTHFGLGSDAQITTAATAIASALVMVWSAYTNQPKELIAAVNSDAVPGVKVVAASERATTVSEPIVTPEVKK